jgi:predicted dehydrogenase
VTHEPLGIAVLGAGRWGSHLIRNFLNHPDARLLAIADPHPDRLQTLTQTLSLTADVVLTTDWRVALEMDGVVGVAIATPATTHVALTQAALKQNLHVLVEKPLTLSWQEGLSLCRLAEEQQRQIVVDHTYLFHPAIQQGKTFIETGQLGDLRYGYATRTHLGPIRQDVDALWDLAIHDIAIFNTWVGQTPTRIQAQGTVWLQTDAPKSDLFPQGLSDLVWVQLIYPSGVQAAIHLCWCNPDKQRRLCLSGSRGTLIFDELASSPLTVQPGWVQPSQSHYTPVGQQVQHLAVSPVEPLHQVCTHFLTCARHNTPSPLSDGWMGLQLVQILQALTQSLQQGGIPIEVKGAIAF